MLPVATTVAQFAARIILIGLAALSFFVAIGCWLDANKRTNPPAAKAGYGFSLFFVLVATVVILTTVNLLFAAKISLLISLVFIAVGVPGRRWAKGLNRHRLGKLIQATPRLDSSEVADAALAQRGLLVALETLLDGEIRLIALALIVVSAVVWTAWALLK